MTYTGYLFLRLFIELFRFVPFWMLYGLSDFLAFVLHRVLGYRKKVVRENLRRAFPEKSPDEIKSIEKSTYRNLSDITLETIKGFTASLDQLNRRCVWINPEKLDAYLSGGQSVIISGAHYNTWEWLCFNIGNWVKGAVYVTYKPLSNRYVDAYYNRQRSRSGANMMRMDETYAVIRQKHGKEACAYFLINDQSPSNVKNAHWIDFFGVDTAFLPGPDFLARRYKYPVLFVNVQRLRRGYYEVRIDDVFSDPSGAAEAEVTRAYAGYLEQLIREAPENWLWSHKRWKRSREQGA